MDNKALLIIGLQNSNSNENEFDISKSGLVLQSISNALNYFRKNELPIFHIKDFNSNNQQSFVDSISDLVPLMNELVIEKSNFNSFYQTNLHEELSKLEIEHLVICGVMTDLSIDATVRNAKELNYQVTLLSDACVARDLELNGIKFPGVLVNNIYLASLNNSYANIVSTKEYISIQEQNKKDYQNLLDQTIENIQQAQSQDFELEPVEEFVDQIQEIQVAKLDDVVNDEEYLIYEYDE